MEIVILVVCAIIIFSAISSSRKNKKEKKALEKGTGTAGVAESNSTNLVEESGLKPTKNSEIDTILTYTQPAGRWICDNCGCENASTDNTCCSCGEKR